jgi:uncharacterized protein with GYD domain
LYFNRRSILRGDICPGTITGQGEFHGYIHHDIRFTQQGLESIKDSPKRAAAFQSAAKKMGVKVTDIYWTLGEYDGILTFDAPDDETATAAMLHLGSQGNVHTTTARAFNASEMDKVIGVLGKK